MATGLFRPHDLFPGGTFIAAGDSNGDHKPDVVIAGGSLSSVPFF